MKAIERFVRVALFVPLVALAIVFDWLSSLMHAAADRIAPHDSGPPGQSSFRRELP